MLILVLGQLILKNVEGSFFPVLLKVQEVFTLVLTSEVPDSSGLKAKDDTARVFLKRIQLIFKPRH